VGFVEVGVTDVTLYMNRTFTDKEGQTVLT
jgi:hypothetical protein